MLDASEPIFALFDLLDGIGLGMEGPVFTCGPIDNLIYFLSLYITLTNQIALFAFP